jgi:hypothetical protein
VPALNHPQQLQLDGREGGQRAADPDGEEGMGEAVLRVVAQTGEGVAEQQGADHVDGEGRPGPLPRAVRRRLRQADPGQCPKDAADVDRSEATKVESSQIHAGIVVIQLSSKFIDEACYGPLHGCY